MPTDPHNIHTITQPSTSQPQKTQKPRKPKRKNTQVPQPSGSIEHVADEVVYKELGDRLVRAATTSSSLETEQDSDSLKLKELMKLCTNLQTRVLDLEKTTTTQQIEIDSLKRRVKMLKKKRSLRSHKLKRLYKVGLTTRVESFGDEKDLGEDASKQGRRINVIDADEDITLVTIQDDADNEIFDVDALTGDEVFAEQEVAAKDVNLTVDELMLPVLQQKLVLQCFKQRLVPATNQQLLHIPTPRKGNCLLLSWFTYNNEIFTTTITGREVQDKGKGKMIEPEPVKPKKKDVQIMLDEEAAKKLQAEFDEEERLAREKDEANVALTEE
ncbi:hypothetical protein Tco_0711385 [Tanacetum coccineum]